MRWLALLLLAAGCAPDRALTDDDDAADDDDSGDDDDSTPDVDDDDSADDDDDSTPDVDDDDTIDPSGGGLDVEDIVTGDWSCANALPDPAGGVIGDLLGVVEDFEEEEPVAGAQVALWMDNDPTGTPDIEIATSFDPPFGAFLLDDVIGACQPFAARVWTEFEPQETIQTIRTGMSVTGSPPYGAGFDSISFATYQLLPLTVGVEPASGLSMLWGRFADCNDDPVAHGELTVGTFDASTGAVVEEDVPIHHFVDESPDGDQGWTSDDGLYGALNVAPAAASHAMLWGIPQDEDHCVTTLSGSAVWHPLNPALCLLSVRPIALLPDSVNLVDSGPRPLPAACY